MNRKLLIGAVVVVGLAGAGGYYGHALLSGEHESTAWARPEPKTSCSGQSCTFTYRLCKPSLPVGSCEVGTYELSQSMGWETNFMPYPRRDHEFTTTAELRSEADARADLIENIHR